MGESYRTSGAESVSDTTTATDRCDCAGCRADAAHNTHRTDPGRDPYYAHPEAHGHYGEPESEWSANCRTRVHRPRCACGWRGEDWCESRREAWTKTREHIERARGRLEQRQLLYGL